jgi:hypothetical protein
MAIQLHMISKNAPIGIDEYDFNLTTPVASQTNQVFGRLTPGFPFVIVGVRWYSTSTTTLTSVDAGTAPTAGGAYTSVLSAQIVPSADAEVAGVLVLPTASTPSTASPIYGTKTSQIIVKYTTGVGPAAVNAFIAVFWRVRPMDGDPVF